MCSITISLRVLKCFHICFDMPKKFQNTTHSTFYQAIKSALKNFPDAYYLTYLTAAYLLCQWDIAEGGYFHGIGRVLPFSPICVRETRRNITRLLLTSPKYMSFAIENMKKYKKKLDKYTCRADKRRRKTTIRTRKMNNESNHLLFLCYERIVDIPYNFDWIRCSIYLHLYSQWIKEFYSKW